MPKRENRYTIDYWRKYPDNDPPTQVDPYENYESEYNSMLYELTGNGWYKDKGMWFTPDGKERYFQIYKAYRILKFKQLVYGK